MPAPAPQDSASSGDVRTRLLEAAGPVFAAQGFDRATVREICAAAGVNVASVAYYFRDKMGLYRDVIQSIRDGRERQFPAPSDTETDARVMLYRLVHTMLSRMLTADSTGWESQLLMREMQQPTAVFGSIVNEFFRPLYNTLTATIQRLVGQPTNPHVVDQLALTVVGQCVYYRFGAGVVEILISEGDREQHFDVESLAKHITSVSIAAAENALVLNKQDELIGLLDANSKFIPPEKFENQNGILES